jgi:hypothetical protein
LFQARAGKIVRPSFQHVSTLAGWSLPSLDGTPFPVRSHERGYSAQPRITGVLTSSVLKAIQTSAARNSLASFNGGADNAGRDGESFRRNPDL